MKKVVLIQRSDRSHWVGNGFPVRTMFSYQGLGEQISPFLLLDYAGPTDFSPTTERRGVGEHPHRGFETVTIVYSGEVEHRDSAGGGGIIKEGDVQWMTAASGLVHDEFHGSEFSKKGGRFEMVQLWVNLPSEFKMTAPRYQGIKSQNIPVQESSDKKVKVRVIAGEFEKTTGAAKTFSNVDLWDIQAECHSRLRFEVEEGQTSMAFVLQGELMTSDGQTVNDAEIALFDKSAGFVDLSFEKHTKLLYLGGRPLKEPIVGYGPFVMNTREEITQAIRDFEDGKMGNLT